MACLQLVLFFFFFKYCISTLFHCIHIDIVKKNSISIDLVVVVVGGGGVRVWLYSLLKSLNLGSLKNNLF